ncbi:MAG: hypothetical protein HGB19_03500 [Chlorobiales bacterium]|nr:hypothetical protein [Chlorobiales bacterium]
MNAEHHALTNRQFTFGFLILLSLFYFSLTPLFAGEKNPASSCTQKQTAANTLLLKPFFVLEDERKGDHVKPPKTENIALDLTLNRKLLVSSIADTLPNTPEQKFQHEFKQRSPFVAAAFSAILPGAGEFYAESYIRSAVFFAAEMIGWAIHIKKLNDGHKAEQKYVNFANASASDGYRNWDARRYAEGLSQIYSSNSDPAVKTLAQYIGSDESLDRIGRGDYSQLNELERLAKFENGVSFSHTLPAYGTQQYYELIGKYDTYTIGWYDYPEEKLNLNEAFDYRSQTFLDYADQRGNANDLLKQASNILIFIVINHALSIVDAVLATSEYNNQVQTHLEVQRSPATGEFMPRATVQFRF